MLVHPRVDLVGVEVQLRAPLDKWDALLGNQAANVADADAEVRSDLVDLHQRAITSWHAVLRSKRTTWGG
jgi:hypothetical protein